ncbi:hypothetical protein M0R45_009077 [Rubus argutus]|uniref:Uncharacterized protein n=1 Tax=Rubus argutus TaxID=59490 RepID=A0AAW1Y603_RUBAR
MVIGDVAAEKRIALGAVFIVTVTNLSPCAPTAQAASNLLSPISFAAPPCPATTIDRTRTQTHHRQAIRRPSQLPADLHSCILKPSWARTSIHAASPLLSRCNQRSPLPAAGLSALCRPSLAPSVGVSLSLLL